MYIWRKINVWFWKETIRGTAVAVSQWIPKTNFSFEDKVEKVIDTSSLWIIAWNSESYITKKWSEWDVEMNLWVESIALPLLSLLWSVVSIETVGGDAYEHIFSLTNSNSHPSITMWIKEDWVSKSFPLCMIESMTISAAVGWFCIVSLTYKWKASATAIHTVNYWIDYKLLAKSWIFKLASNLAGLDAASGVCIESFEITISKNLEEVFCLWSLEPKDITNKQITIEWSFVAKFENEAQYKDTTFSDDTKALRLQLIDTTKTIWVSDHPSFTLDLPKAAFTEWEKSWSNDEILTQTITFNWLYSVVDDLFIEVSLINETASY